MGIEENKAIVRQLVERMSDGDSSVIDELTTDNFIMHSLAEGGRDVDKSILKQTNDGGHAGFPDYHMEINDMICEGDKVMVRSTRTGTHTGDFFGMVPTGNFVRIARIALYRIENGKIAEMWLIDDMLGQSQQLGILGTRMEITQAFIKSGGKRWPPVESSE